VPLAGLLREAAGLTALVPFMREHANLARRHYSRASEDPVLSPAVPSRMRVRLFMKILELYKIELLTVAAPDLGPLQKMLSSFIARHEGRNQNFHDFALFESTRCADIATIRETYPARCRLEGCSDLTAAAPGARARLLAQGP
jgi:hypothetical protein